MDSSFAALKNADVEESGLGPLARRMAGTLSLNDRVPRVSAKRTMAGPLHASDDYSMEFTSTRPSSIITVIFFGSIRKMNFIRRVT